MDKSLVMDKFFSLINPEEQQDSESKCVHREPTDAELELIHVMLKLNSEKQKLWFTAFSVIWDYEKQT